MTDLVGKSCRVYTVEGSFTGKLEKLDYFEGVIYAIVGYGVHHNLKTNTMTKFKSANIFGVLYVLELAYE